MPEPPVADEDELEDAATTRPRRTWSPDADVEAADVPLIAVGVSPNASSYSCAATRLPLAAAVWATVVVVACDVR